MGTYASMRRSRRNGQYRRVSSINPRSISPSRISSASWRLCSHDSATDQPENCRPELRPSPDAHCRSRRRAPLLRINSGHVDSRVSAIAVRPLNGLPAAYSSTPTRPFRRDANRWQSDKTAPPSTLQRGETGDFRIPLISSRQAFPRARMPCRPLLKTQISRRKVILLVVKRIIRNMHLADRRRHWFP